MKLIVIANISNGKETIGFRLLDIDTKQTKDVPAYNIASALKSSEIQIDNLIIKDGIILGYNGSIDRLPKIVGVQLTGKSPLIILNKLGDIGYTVSDYKGTIANVKEADLIEYAKNNGISNGKIVSKDNREFISSIEGNYTVINIDSTLNKVEPVYTGEAVIGAKSLPPIIITEYNSYSYQVCTKIIYPSGSKIETAYVGTPNDITLANITKNITYKYDKYTLYHCIAKEIDIRDTKNKKETLNIIRTESFRKSIDQSISNRYSAKHRIDKKTGIAIPTHDNRYMNVCVDIQVDNKDLEYDDLSNEEIQSYINKLRVMKVKCYIQYMIPCSEKMALLRKCSNAGISYEIAEITKYNSLHTRDMTIEEIYYYNKEYTNVIVDGTELKIIGLDGVYKYDMSKIHKIYNREIIQSTKNAKAVLLGHNHIEDVSVTGGLKKIKTSLKVLVIPNNVKTIEEYSIILSPENTDIIFGNEIEQCSRRAIQVETGNIKYIEIGGKTARDDILSSLYGIKYHLNNFTIHFIDDITPEEYIKIIYNTHNCKDITISNVECINDGFIIKVIAEAIKSRLNNLDIIKSKIKLTKGRSDKKQAYSFEIDYALSEFKNSYVTLKQTWLTKLDAHASEGLKSKVDKLFNDIDKKIEFREKEATDTKNKLDNQEEIKYNERQRSKQIRKENSW